ncbi:hypothetical protein ACFLTH_09690, partial [Bacteroidota bacterium]
MNKDSLPVKVISGGMALFFAGQAIAQNFNSLEQAIEAFRIDKNNINCLPVDMSGWGGLGTAEIDLDKFVWYFKEQADQKKEIAEKLKGELPDLLNPNHVYQLEKTAEDGTMFFKHDPAQNNIATMAQFANEYQIPFENAAEWAAANMVHDGAKNVTSEDIVFTINGNGEYVDFFAISEELKGKLKIVGNEQTVFGYGKDGTKFKSGGKEISIFANSSDAAIDADSDAVIDDYRSVYIVRGDRVLEGKSPLIDRKGHILVKTGDDVLLHPDHLKNSQNEVLLNLLESMDMADKYEHVYNDLENLLDL